jgi:hypothetical protein
MTMDGIRYTKRTDAGRHLQHLVAQQEQDLLKSSHRRLEERPGELGGFPVTVTVERVLGSMNVILVLDGAPGTEIRMNPAEVRSVDPGKLIIRLENRLSGLESLSSRFQSEIDQLTAEATHARDDIARSFPQADQLAAARDRVARLEEKLRERVAPSRRSSDDWLTAAAMHDMGAMAGIPGAALNGSGHQNSQPQSAAQVSRQDFPLDNPLAGATPGSGQVASNQELKHLVPSATSAERLLRLDEATCIVHPCRPVCPPVARVIPRRRTTYPVYFLGGGAIRLTSMTSSPRLLIRSISPDKAPRSSSSARRVVVPGPMVTSQSSNSVRTTVPACPRNVISYVCACTGLDLPGPIALVHAAPACRTADLLVIVLLGVIRDPAVRPMLGRRCTSLTVGPGATS